MDLLIARNPDPDSTLKLLILVPIGTGRVYRTSDTWPRTKALFCYPVSRDEWPAEPELVETIPLLSCESRGGAIDIVAKRGREFRSQIVHTRGRGRPMVFWQAPKTRKQAKPAVRIPTARAAGLTGLEIVIDTRERYAYKFPTQQASTRKAALRSGDYGIFDGDELVAAVERKSIEDFASSLINSKLRYQMLELATLPRAAVVVEERYSRIFKHEHIRGAVLADGLAELAIRFPTVPIFFAETRALAEEWTYRFLAAAVAHRDQVDPETSHEPDPSAVELEALDPGPADLGATDLGATGPSH